MLGSAQVASQSETYVAVAQFLYRIAQTLDKKDFKAWLDVCAPELHYTINTFSFEIRKDVTFLDHDLDGMTILVKQLPRHNTDQSMFTRHVTVETVEADADSAEIKAISSVTIYRTTLDGGTTAIFAVGRYYDTVVNTPEGWRLRARDVRLDTRNLGIGTHYPL
jgi:methanesulfonate monooxygenase subunit beta